MNLLSYILLILVAGAFVAALRLAYFSRGGKKSCCRGGDCDKCKSKYRKKGV